VGHDRHVEAVPLEPTGRFYRKGFSEHHIIDVAFSNTNARAVNCKLKQEGY
jgi:hypothetical protein